MTSRPARAIETVFLDAGGVLVHPNWVRVADALTARGVATTTAALTAAEPHAKREMDLATLMARTDDRQRGWIYFESVLRHAGLDASTPGASAALAEVRAYHDVHNVWEHVPADVVPMLRGPARARSCAWWWCRTPTAGCTRCSTGSGLTPHVDVILDSHHFGVEKPDPRLFHLALAESGAVAATTVHVGDFFHIDVGGARAAGLAEAVLFDIAALYDDADCPRVHRLAALVDFVAAKNAGRLNWRRPTLRHEPCRCRPRSAAAGACLGHRRGAAPVAVVAVTLQRRRQRGAGVLHGASVPNWPLASAATVRASTGRPSGARSGRAAPPAPRRSRRGLLLRPSSKASMWASPLSISSRDPSPSAVMRSPISRRSAA